jgi:DNA-binding transcriptional LysR family regulator
MSSQAMANRKPSQSWDNLRYFLAVARTGTLSAAADQLGTEHTTVARHIYALEEELNSRLFHRSNSGYGLTEVGERLLAGAEAIESAYASAKAAASSEDQTISGTVRIGTPDGFGSLFLAPRVRVLTDRHPNLEIEILVTARQFSLLKREADIVIGLSRPEHMRVVSRRLTDYRMYVYGSLAYLEKATPIVTMQDLKNHPFIGYVEATDMYRSFGRLHPAARAEVRQSFRTACTSWYRATAQTPYRLSHTTGPASRRLSCTGKGSSKNSIEKGSTSDSGVLRGASD